MTFGSLFSGVGGFDLGFERAGMRCVWQVENDPFCIRVLERHWPNVRRYRDVRKFAPNRDEHACDVLCGGFPCQDLSIAGKRAGLGGARSGLFCEFVRVASVLRPAFVVLENVPGLLNSQGGRDMGTVIAALLDCGYRCAWRVLDSRYFGVAQRRRRVFIVGHSRIERAVEVLFEREGGSRNPAPLRKAGTDIAHSLDGGTGGVSGKENQRTIVAACLQSRIGKGEFTDPVNDNIIVYPTIDANEGRKWGSNQLVNQGKAICCSPPDGNRMRETPGVSRRMDAAPDGPRYKALGNAVTVNVAEWIGRRIMQCDSPQ